ncbi:hypothetical protein HNR23_003011 [Nocardiopsis mwathae]|uniref:Subtilisin inhibitor domain-containing protein n=1 Tax=Nocardiopsis mwathae TaxID=1472723 RepID=A0A7W9YK02_9ACTN|nr:SSI family serine proteinase inhibitor [Nocardiopsis mwathae]MBB6172951.1 hypothetical protein [Nocardiopsis mwathae]
MRIRHTLAVAGAFALAAPLVTGAAHAAPQGVDGQGADIYHIAVVPGSQSDRGRSLEWEGARSAVLTCNPAGGTHSQARHACEDIDAFGSIAGIPARGEICPLSYDPVTAFAQGAERYAETFPNECVLRDSTRAVFHF